MRILEGAIPLKYYGVLLNYGSTVVSHWDDVRNKMVYISTEAGMQGVLTIEGCAIVID
jgi:lipid-binding SYLF domain-containing protein